MLNDVNPHVEPTITMGSEPAIQRLGEILILRGKLDAANLDRALKVQETARSAGAIAEKLGSVLSRLGMLSSRELAEALAQQRGWTIVESSEFPELPILEETVSPRFLNEVRAIPVTETDVDVVLAMTDPADAYTVKAVAAATGKRVTSKLLAGADFDAIYERLYGSGKSSMGQIVDNISTRDEEQDFGDIEQLKDLASEAPVIRLVNLIINHALERRASDIHVEPFENRLISDRAAAFIAKRTAQNARSNPTSPTSVHAIALPADAEIPMRPKSFSR